MILEKRKVLFVVPDGVGIRNYLYSDMISGLTNEGFDVLLMHNLDKELINLINARLNTPLNQIELNFFREKKIQTLLRESTTFARLKSNARTKNNPTILENWVRGNVDFKRKLFLHFAKFLGSFLNNYRSIQFLESLIEKLWKDTEAFIHYQEILMVYKPDLIFITHQRVPSLVPFCLAASSLKIKTISAIYSWDNLPKARLPIRTDFYAVWSDHMKNELLDFYPEIRSSQIFVTGTPQFDFYSNTQLIISRIEFAKRYNLDPEKRWVLFSGDDELTSPYDALYLKDVAEALVNLDNIEILFRQVPVSSVDRYRNVIENFPNIKHIPPLWMKGQNWNSFFPLFEDIQLLTNLCFHCGTVINIGSTMALDFSFFNKPGIFLKYDVLKDPNWSTSTVYNFQHFRSFIGLDAVVFIEEKSEIESKILQVLNTPESVAVDRIIWRNKIVKNDFKASLELEKVINSVVEQDFFSKNEN